MKRLTMVTSYVFMFFLITACQMSSNVAPTIDYKGLSAKPGVVAFGAITDIDEKQYLIEQEALFRGSLEGTGVDIERQEHALILNIPGNISFGINSAGMTWNLHSILDKISPVLKEYKYTSILLLGHSDSRGDPEVNLLLSEQRAKAIYHYLINSSVPAERMKYEGVGDKDLLIKNAETTLDNALNRRVTIEITVNKSEPEQNK
ncbi:MAG: OmpA family protein [Methyloprofundus sp.]|nr:OmpA family protein [Methyloprofundus sp.]MDT8424728.1 OmpA family protein [Methyloprofundus sp.]